jgi:hypothetical protein
MYNCIMDAVTLQQMLDDVFDDALVHHGYVDYMRDYEVIVSTIVSPRAGVEPVHLRYLFRHCVEAHCRTTVSPDSWRGSLDDRLIDYETGVDLDGYVWGVKWQPLFPGATVVPESASAHTWAKAVGIEFHEVRIETNAHDLTLVFSELQVSEVPVGYAPFVVREDA